MTIVSQINPNRLSPPYDNAKVKEQALVDARTVLDIAGIYDKNVLETACSLALKDFYLVTYNTLVPYVKKIKK